MKCSLCQSNIYDASKLSASHEKKNILIVLKIVQQKNISYLIDIFSSFVEDVFRNNKLHTTTFPLPNFLAIRSVPYSGFLPVSRHIVFSCKKWNTKHEVYFLTVPTGSPWLSLDPLSVCAEAVIHLGSNICNSVVTLKAFSFFFSFHEKEEKGKKIIS